MFAVVFEVRPRDGRKDEYLDLAGSLRPLLLTMDGFIEVERFESRHRPGWVLSLSTWRDEKSVVRWRCQREHHDTQKRGRFERFADYRLRVCEVTADSRAPEAVIQQRFDETEVGDAKAIAVTEFPPAHDASAAEVDLAGAEGLTAHDVFESLYNPGKTLLLTSWTTPERAGGWRPGATPEGLRHRRVRIVRDYGLVDRREAPQYYPPVRDLGQVL